MAAERPGQRGLYPISVVAELLRLDPQTLRLYERYGLVEPSRTPGGTRRYSDEDLERLRRISALVEQGVNLSAVALVLELQDHNSRLQDTNSRLRSTNASLRAQQASSQQEQHDERADGDLRG